MLLKHNASRSRRMLVILLASYLAAQSLAVTEQITLQPEAEDSRLEEASTDSTAFETASIVGGEDSDTSGLARSECRSQVYEVIVADSGSIVLQEFVEDCSEKWTWILKPPHDGVAFVLQFNDVYLRYRSSLLISTMGMNTSSSARSFTYEYVEAKFTPVFIETSNDVVITLETPYISYKYTLTSINISFSTQDANTLPVSIPLSQVSDPTSRQMYDCTGQNVVVPPALRCNRVRECLMGEDEQGCERDGCSDGWIPFRDHCLLLTFATRFASVLGHAMPTHPSEAEETCRSEHGGELALLMDAEGTQFLGRILRLSGFNSLVVGLRKTKPESRKLRHLYRYTWQWGDKGSPVSYDSQQLQRDGPLLDCTVLAAYPSIHFKPLRCLVPDTVPDGFACMRPNPTRQVTRTQEADGFHFQDPDRRIDRIQSKKCPDGSLVQIFHDCREKGESAVRYNSSSVFSSFACRFGPPVHYSLVCDGVDDCVDGSDEMDCASVKFPPLADSTFQCGNKQLVSAEQRCDGKPDCFDETDEEHCTDCSSGVFCNTVGCVPTTYSMSFDSCPVGGLYANVFYQPEGAGVVKLDGYGMSTLEVANENTIQGKFPCDKGHFIPSYLVSNGELDCAYGDDENIASDNYTCPGFYRCQYTSICVHPDNVCDGIYQCPNKDDERYCDLVCPDDCVCEGFAYCCFKLVNVTGFVNARYLDLSYAVNVSLFNLNFIENLKFLNLSHCGLGNVSIKAMPHMEILDLSFNNLIDLDSLDINNMYGLRYLNISGNPLIPVLDSSFTTLAKLSGLNSLEEFAMQNVGLLVLEDNVFSCLAALRVLDIRDNPIESYGKYSFGGLGDLEVLLTDDSKLCCSYFHEALSLKQCVAPVDELSSCDDLLRLDFYRAFLWLFAVLAITGNTAVLLYRLFAKTQTSSRPFRVLVANLCASDLLMGIYLFIVGVADFIFRGHYVSEEKTWKESVACKMAGFLGFVSSEVSALMICVITFDRLLVVQFPLKVNLHMSTRFAAVLSGVVWFLGATMASLPLLADLEFYGETGICLPLPITRRQYSGQWYAFGVFIVLNFVLFCLVGACQALIYRTIRKVGRSSGSERRSRDLLIARRLFLIAFTDFCCWFPVGVMGLMAASGFPIPDSITVITAVFFLPINSALNPFLYTINSIVQKRQESKLKMKAKKLLGNFQVELSKLPPEMAQEVVRVCIRSKAANRDKMLQWLQLRQDSNRCTGSNEEKTSSFNMSEMSKKSEVETDPNS